MKREGSLLNQKYLVSPIIKITLVILSLMVALLFGGVNSRASGEVGDSLESRQILVFHGYHKDFSWTKTIDGYIDEAVTLSSASEFDFYVEYLDALRFAQVLEEEKALDFFIVKYKDVDFDGILCFDENGRRFAQLFNEKRIESGKREIPLIFVGTQAYPFEALTDKMVRLQPNLNKISIFTQRGQMNAKQKDEAQKIAQAHDIKVTIYEEDMAESYILMMTQAQKDEAIILVSSLVGETGALYPIDKILEQYSASFRVPVYTFTSYHVGLGATGATYVDIPHYLKVIFNAIQRPESLRNPGAFDGRIPTKTVIDYSRARLLNLNVKELLSIMSKEQATEISMVNHPSLLLYIQDHLLEFVIFSLVIISVVLVFAILNLLMRLKAEKDRESARIDLQISYMELEAAHEEMIASEAELSRQFNELQQKEQDLRASRERYRLAAKGAEFGIWDYDFASNSIYLSVKAQEILNLDRVKEWYDMGELMPIFSPYDKERLKRALQKHAEGKTDSLEMQFMLVCDETKDVWINLRGKILFDAQRQPKRLAGSLANISDTKLAEERLHRIAFYDELTGLPNRAYYEQRMRAIEGQLSQGDFMGVATLFIDLDNFKHINESLGHQYGDKVLVRLAKLLREIVSEAHDVIRFGGDEFIILIQDFESQSELEVMATKLLERFDKSFETESGRYSVTLSIGIATYPRSVDQVEHLLKYADMALSEAKLSGKNQYQFYTKKLSEQFNTKMSFERDLRQAIENEEFELYYQPKYCIKKEKICGYEALLRWHHPLQGMISPLDFIPIAEESGLIIPLGNWVIQEAISCLNRWHKAGHKDLTMAINISPRQFKDELLLESFIKALEGTEVEAKAIEIEVTETMALHDMDYAIGLLAELRQRGFKIALDDFGTGYSSLNYLSELPIDILKIDKTFMAKSVKKRSGEIIIKSVISLARAHDLVVVAEGVETLEQLNFLRDESCDVIQGYYISKPLPAAEAIALVDGAWIVAN